MIAARRKRFFDDVIGHCFAVEENETLPTEDEILANCVFFLHAGARNTSASLTNAVLALLRHPKEFSRLRENPQSISTAVEELLRYDTPVQVAIRGVPEQIEFAGRRIGPSQSLFSCSAPQIATHSSFRSGPARLMRKPNRHLSFGVGRMGASAPAGALWPHDRSRSNPPEGEQLSPRPRETGLELPLCGDGARAPLLVETRRQTIQPASRPAASLCPR